MVEAHARASKHSDRKHAFAQRLRAAMTAKHWTPAQTLEAARAFLSPSENLAHAHLSHYLHGRAIPRQPYLTALSRALDVSERELLGHDLSATNSKDAINFAVTTHRRPPPSIAAGQPLVRVSEFHLGNATKDEAWIEINQRVPWSTALEILRLLKAEGKTD